MKQIRPSPPPQLPSFQTFNLQTMALAHLRIGTPMNSWLSRGSSSHDCSAPSSGQGRVRDLRSPLFPQTTSPMVTRNVGGAPSEEMEEPPPLQRLRVPAELEWKPPTTRPFEERRDGPFDGAAFYCHDPADSQLPFEPDDTKVVKREPVKREARVRQLPRVTEFLRFSEHSEKEWQSILSQLAGDDGTFLPQLALELSPKYEHYIIHVGIGQGKACDHLPSKLTFNTWYILNPRDPAVYRKKDVALIKKNGDLYNFPDDDEMPFLNVVSNSDHGVVSHYTFGRAGISEGLRNQHIVEGKEVWYQVSLRCGAQPIEGKVVCLANGTVFEISMKPEECPLCLGRPGDNKSGIANAGHGYIFNVCHPCYEAYNSKSGKLALRIKGLQSAEVVDDEPLENEPVKAKVLKRPVEVEAEAPRTKSRIMRMPVKTDHYKPLETVKIRKPPLKPSIGSDYRAPVKLPKSDDEPVKVKSRKLPVKAAIESDSEDEAESEPEVSLDNAEGQIQFVEDILTSIDGFINLNKVFTKDQRKALNIKIGKLYEKLDDAY